MVKKSIMERLRAFSPAPFKHLENDTKSKITLHSGSQDGHLCTRRGTCPWKYKVCNILSPGMHSDVIPIESMQSDYLGGGSSSSDLFGDPLLSHTEQVSLDS